MPVERAAITQLVDMTMAKRRAAAVVLSLVMLSAGALQGARARERRRANAEVEAAARAQRAAEKARAVLERWPDEAQASAETAASLSSLAALVQAGDEKRLRELVGSEAWAPFRQGGSATAVLVGGRVVAFSGAPELLEHVTPMVAEAMANGAASGWVAAPVPRRVGAARVVRAGPSGLPAVVVLVEPVGTEALGLLATRLDATLAVSPVEGTPVLAGAQVATLSAFRRSGERSAPCCARRALTPELELAVGADSSQALADGARAGATVFSRWLVASGVLALVVLVAGFRRGRPLLSRVPPPRETPLILQARTPRPPIELRLVKEGEAPAEAEPVPEPPLEALAPRFEVLRELGDGGRCRVFLATMTAPDGSARRVVLERLRDELTFDEQLVAEFLEEARVRASLDHPTIVPVSDFGRDAQGCFRARDDVAGWSLEAVVQASLERAHRPLDASVVLYVAQEVLRALVYAHARCAPDGEWLGLVHKDLSPRNVLVTETGEVKLLGFAPPSGPTQAHFLEGDVRFMSPEQARGQPVEARSDLFSLAQVLFFAASGAPLYSAGAPRELSARAAAGLTVADWMRVDLLPEPFPALLDGSLATAPSERVASAEAWLAQLPPAEEIATASEVQALLTRLFAAQPETEASRSAAGGT